MEADIFLLGEIETENENPNEDFCHELSEAIEDPNINIINIRITSVGGSVNKGMEIIDLIDHARRMGKMVNSYINLAYSMAACIALYCDKVFMNDFGILMLHSPYPESEDSYYNPEFLKVLELYKKMLIQVASVKRKINIKKVEELMNAESFMGAEEAFKLGLVDEIISSSEMVKKMEYNIFLKEKKRFSIAAKIKIENNQKSKKMDRILGILNVASEDMAIQKINEIKSASADALNKANEKDQVIAELKAKLDAINLQNATDLVENAVKNGIIEASQKQEWVSLANTNYELAKKTIDAIKIPETKQVSLADIVNGSKNNANSALPIDFDRITYQELEAKYPDVLAKMDIEKVKEIIDRSFN